jgi:hypothetical protein
MATPPTLALQRVYWHPMWNPWRNNPRFVQMIAKFGRTEEYKTARETLARMQLERAGKK